MSQKERIHIREATFRDAKILKGFWLKLASEMFEIGSHFFPSDENSEMWLSFVYRGIKKRRATILLAQKGRKPIGFIHLTYPENKRYQTPLRFATIHEIYVDPTHGV
jgi:hypothetical protein